MSINNWIGGLIKKTPPTPSGPYQNSTAPGIWTLTQVANYVKQAIWPTAGNLNPDLFIENLFSTYLYTGTGSSQTITTNIDTTTYGGLVWIKGRSALTGHRLTDTARGVTKSLASNDALAEATESTGLTAFGTSGFTIGADADYNTNAATYVSWTFRKQAKFFDIVTYSGDSVDNRAISHNLGSTPGCIIVRRLSGDDWFVYHRSLAANFGLRLNKTDDATSNTSTVKSVSSTTFTVGTDGLVNTSGSNYVAYLFAHDAGGFGLTGAENVISCGSVTSTGDNTVTLGYEPQFLLVKKSNTAGDWVLVDTMRGWVDSSGGDIRLYPNLTSADDSGSVGNPVANGFRLVGASGDTYIYIAIRRGPMKTPTSGTSVFAPVTQSANTTTVTTNFPVDLSISAARNGADETTVIDRLRGGVGTTNSYWLYTASTSSEGNAVGTAGIGMDNMTSLQNNYWGSVYRANSGNIAYWSFRRAPGFFDEVCYTGTGTNTAFNHNLGVTPEMMITKIRDSSIPNWGVWHNALSPSSAMLFLNTTGTQGNGYVDTVTSTTFSFATANGVVNTSPKLYVAYLFASCPGVSKVGSYTGTGALQTINCGFTGGARFVLIKRTDSTGDWWVYDSARGITSGNDPYLFLNSTAAEVTGTNYVDTDSTGFKVTAAAPAGLNANGGTFIFLAIA